MYSIICFLLKIMTSLLFSTLSKADIIVSPSAKNFYNILDDVCLDDGVISLGEDYNGF